jgi:hypothetical protein
MSDLISGKEALIALANGQEVEYQAMDKNFYPLQDFLDSAKIRLKPKTILLNGIEVPASENSYNGGLIWILCGTDTREYTSLALDEADDLPAYFWKSEEEIKQVVAALRSIFNVK